MPTQVDSREQWQAKLSANLAGLNEQIEQALRASGRKRSELTLVAVSKTYPAMAVEAALELGLTDYGENRVQELLAKMRALDPRGAEIAWHLIGTLQRNKIKYIIGKVKLIHSVHSLPLLLDLEQAAAKLELQQEILLQFNIAQERSKHGFAVPELSAICSCLKQCPHLLVRGLMTMAPYSTEVACSARVFQAGRQLGQKLQEALPSAPCDILSMGMSHDFAAAIAAGATHIRLGSALFGEREYIQQ